LTAPVDVAFDEYAIPHLYAESAGDLWVAMGYLHARERLWQMELYRRASAGRLSELFGEQTLGADRRFLRLGLRRAAEAELAAAEPDVRSALQQYALGVNAAIRAAGGWRLPAEFLALRTRPAPWNAADSLAVGKLMAWRLGENHRAELVRYALADALTRVEVAELMGIPPDWAPAIIDRDRTRLAPVTNRSPDDPGVPDRTDQPVVEAALPEGLGWLAGSRALSNSWVVSGSRTTTGRPLLANDPHLSVEMPSLWYEAHLVAPDLDVTGVTIPGVPFVLIGHNQRIAWGLTNVGTDVQDLYVEQVDVDQLQYLDRGTWMPLEVERHEIPVRGRPPVPFSVYATPRGPVASAAEWSGAAVGGTLGDELGKRPLAFRWDVIAEGETSGGFEALGRAQDWDQFLDAVWRIAAPAQNFVYADVDGNIGYAMSGLVPVRAAHDGSIPMLGWTGDHDWRGYLDPRTLPTAFNPPTGAIVAANNEVDRRFPGLIVHDWVAPFRAARIARMLDGRDELDIPAFERMQADRASEAARLVLPAVDAAAAAARQGEVDAEVVAALDRLRLWDGTVDARPVVALYEAFVEALWRRAFVDELGEGLFQAFYDWAARERFAGLYMIIGDPTSSWWDDRTTSERREHRDDVVIAATRDALERLSERFGSDSASDWTWDRLHAVRFSHALAGGGSVLDWFFSRGPVPIAGDGYTVNKTSIDPGAPYATTDLASYRQILDVGAWDNSLGVMTTGQSGHPRSPHYFDQNALWREGRYHALPYSREVVLDARVSALSLVP
jgi:penicillin amidase